MVSAGKKTQSDAKKARLEAALRENLKRRKTQARAKAAGATGEMGTAPWRPPKEQTPAQTPPQTETNNPCDEGSAAG